MKRLYKLLIVEDERWEREGLVEFLDWASFGIEIVGTAFDGIDGLEKTRALLPDIVITDIRMPGMDGLEMARIIKEERPGVRIIVLTGYGDFEYARKAIRFNASHYVLKPVEEHVLIEALDKVLDECGRDSSLRRETQTLREEMEDQRRLVREGWAQELLHGTLKPGCADELADWSGFGRVQDAYTVLAVASVGKWDREAIRKAVPLPHIAVYEERLGGFWLLILQAGAVRPADAFARRLAERLAGLGGFVRAADVTIGIGTEAAGLLRAADSARAAEQALAYGLFWLDRGPIGPERLEEEASRFANEAVDFLQKAGWLVKQIVFHVQALDEEQALGSTDALFAELQSRRGADGDYVRNYLSGLLFELSVVSGSGGQGEHGALPPSGRTLSELLTVKDIQTYLTGFVRTCLTLLRNKRGSKEEYIIGSVNRIIEQQYMTGDISLKSVADQLFISPNYLGSLYKKATGHSFHDKLARIRMDKAKELLGLRDFKVSRVAREVGYSNTSYFCTVFKDTYGITPGEYQETVHRK